MGVTTVKINGGNMREIKFRAWNKRQKVMGVEMGLNDLLEYTAENPHRVSEVPYLETMQYTGLKDKNGKEIYESDYLNVWLDGIGNEVFRVDWDSHKARFILVDKLGDTWSFDDSNDTEVIGNKFGNPELLK
jgi:uncharacterized phage protein (TIGR01671 family)